MLRGKSPSWILVARRCDFGASADSMHLDGTPLSRRHEMGLLYSKMQ